MHCIPCGSSLQDIPQTWSECTSSSQLYTAWADTVGAYRVCWSVHWLKSSFNATNHYIYWIYFTFYYSHRWVNEQETPKQCLNKWVGPRNKKEAKVCTCLTWPLLLAQYQLVFFQTSSSIYGQNMKGKNDTCIVIVYSNNSGNIEHYIMVILPKKTDNSMESFWKIGLHMKINNNFPLHKKRFW